MQVFAMERFGNDLIGKGKAEQRKETLSDETLWNSEAERRRAKAKLTNAAL